MPLSTTSIANLALRRIGIQQTIADIHESGNLARACAAFYPHTLEMMLRERPWPFAQRWVDLALVSENPSPEFGYAYRYPNNYLKINRLVDRNVIDSTRVFTPTFYGYGVNGIEYNPAVYPAKSTDYFDISSDDSGRLILANTENARAQGTYHVEDTAMFDPLFADALSWKLAADISVGLTKDNVIISMCMQKANESASLAFASTLNEQTERPEQDAGVIRAML